MKERWNRIVEEFTHHFPYTMVGSLVAMAGVWWFGTQQLGHSSAQSFYEQSRASFHLFHPLHICLSAIATTSLFWRHDKSIPRAVWVGLWGTILPCGLSDYFFPYIGGLLLGQPMHLHVCIVEHPQLFFPFLGFGILAGFWAEEKLAGSHLFSHGAHVFVSSAASLLYLCSFGFTSWMQDARLVFPAFAIIVIAVWVPCCISDIVIPSASVAGQPSDHHKHHGHSH